MINQIQFPEPTGLKCNMLPFVQGDSSSLPQIYNPYSKVINENFLEKGEIGFLTIDESFVEGGKSQRGYSSSGGRNVHIEVGRNKDCNRWGGNPWGGRFGTLLENSTKVLIANSVSETCRVWDNIEMRFTKNGDLADYVDEYPENTGRMLKSGEVAKISIFTPHECINQKQSGDRQFFRVVGKGVKGREDYFTVNPLISWN